MKQTLFFTATLLSLAFYSCEKDRGINLFSLQQDMDLGDSLSVTIGNDPTNYPVLQRSTDANSNAYKAYAYIDGMMADILKSDKFKYGTTFNWEVTIINADVMNAFAAPGGKLYFYTGLITYLDDAASLAGVMGHEMAHADLRHSTQVMTKAYGFDLLLSILLGQDPNEMKQLVAGLAKGAAELKFSRDNEYDADRYSMYYLASTKYEPLGIKAFFEKLQSEGKTGTTFEWLSTHPSDQNRINNADKTYAEDKDLKTLMTGHTYTRDAEGYTAFKALLR